MNNEEQKSEIKNNKKVILSLETKIENNDTIKMQSNEFEKILIKIQEVQGLPKEVVKNFLNAKGKIKNKNFAKNLNN
ncbi:MAG: hypothetical protein STSR0008_03200 [Ignavibacterium sp.]